MSYVKKTPYMVRLDDAMVTALQARAVLMGQPVSQVIRQAVRAYLVHQHELVEAPVAAAPTHKTPAVVCGDCGHARYVHSGDKFCGSMGCACRRFRGQW